MHKYWYKAGWFRSKQYICAKNIDDLWKKIKQLYPEHIVKSCFTIGRVKKDEK